MSGRTVVHALGDQREVLTTAPADVVELPGDFGGKRVQGHVCGAWPGRPRGSVTVP
ncbi:hypothetical protein OHU45_00520 [Streptomyces tubercidicus]|uniref:hypothetical protein n=1 Tax=Streptomyces tubercidicus TaxID=47759 RepID=UPI0030DFB334|nr:hypothetical protein OG690_37480 [Streptomyces tubercidicus]